MTEILYTEEFLRRFRSLFRGKPSAGKSSFAGTPSIHRLRQKSFNLSRKNIGASEWTGTTGLFSDSEKGTRFIL